jgi:hypothetical protein
MRPSSLARTATTSRSFATNKGPNNSLQPTGCFVRSSGHPELTVQECGNAETRTENDL